MKIFVSYRREDSAGHAGRLYDSLQAHFGKESLFMDLTAIEPGQNFVDVIKTAVGSCDALIAVIGKQWLMCTDAKGRRLDDPGDFVRTEIRTALERGVPIIPVLIESATMPSAEALPDGLKLLAERNALELSDNRWSFDVERLIQAVEKFAGKPPLSKRLSKFSLPALIAIFALLALLSSWSLWLTGDRTLERDANEQLAATGGDSQAPASDAGKERASRSSAEVPSKTSSSVRIVGNWRAEVTYDWGAKYTEHFTFKLDDDEILGTASYLGSSRGIVAGKLSENRVQFHTKTQVVSGGDYRDVVHHYRGRVVGDEITFSMLTEGGIPIEFIAKRVPDKVIQGTTKSGRP